MVKHLNVCANRYDIVNKELGDLWGHCDLIKRKIYLDKGSPRREKTITLFHEAIHAALKEYGVSQYITHEAEEMTVRILEVAVCKIFMDNRAFSRQFVRDVIDG